MKIRLLAMVLALGASLPATAQITTVQRAYEVPLATVRLPASESGTLAFKPCAECSTTTARVTSDTRWLVNRRAVSLQEFLSAVESRADRSKDYVTVRHHLENDLITKVTILIR